MGTCPEGKLEASVIKEQSEVTLYQRVSEMLS
jgi:hypothetical protein